ncbi:armadillo-type protein [Pisolithus croceorrhizus]|nr:armadillo-type protein [Pisolithus croceorrhizus]KAI6134238.1 armadillo-type protein [Pisolithus croceorrhizus]
MAQPSFLPALPQSDIVQAAQLIQQAYSPSSVQVSSDTQRRLQQELFDIQKRYEAWGLVIPFLNHEDFNVQFFGAHTVQVKIARDWESFPPDDAPFLRDLLLELISHAVLSGKNKVILRKLFVAITSLALKLATGTPSGWPDWIVSTVEFLSSRGVPTRSLLEFLSIVAEEVESADLVGPRKMQMKQTLLDASPLVVRAITGTISQPRSQIIAREVEPALKCLQAWMSVLRADDITPLIPLLILLLNPSTPDAELDPDVFTPASDTLQEIMSCSPLAAGAGTATLTEPLLLWLDIWGTQILRSSSSPEHLTDVSHSLCKLITTLGDHSNIYFASNITSHKLVPGSQQMRSQLIQGFLRLLLSYTGLPGYYGVDEEESEMTLGFWYLLQESLWGVDFDEDGEGREVSSSPLVEEEQNRMAVVHAVYAELVKVLRRKVAWPPQNVLESWTKDQVEKFQVYRRDVGDTLINAYYILRNDMLAYYLNDIQERLLHSAAQNEWEEIEATLHCIMSIQEALPLEDNPLVSQLFGSEILGHLPRVGQDRVRRTMLGLIGTYASWFTTQNKAISPTSSPSLLMNAISYVVAALPEPSLCLPAANSLRDLCDANRIALAPHISAFGELHAGLTGIPETEKSKVLQSIASVIQALPPQEEIPPILAIVNPVVEKLVHALGSSSQLPDEARSVMILQLQTLAGVSKGLTRTTDSLLVLEESSPADQAEAELLRQARNDYRMVKLREDIFNAIRSTIEIWSGDASVSDALSDLIRSVTSLPSDTTLLSLPAGPLLGLICIACQRHLTAVWLSLAKSLVIQLDPPPPFVASTIKSSPNAEAIAILSDALPVILQTSLSMLGRPGALESNPDIVQAFFGCLDSVAKHFVAIFYKLPPGALDALMQCAVRSLSLQERYSLVATCTFLETLVRRTASSDELGDTSTALVHQYGQPILRAVLCGFAGVAPRSATANLIELLSTIASKHPAETREWMNEILFADDFVESRATPEAKRAFVKAVIGSRSPKKTREAAQQFALIARGLEGTSFGYASVTM